MERKGKIMQNTRETVSNSGNRGRGRTDKRCGVCDKALTEAEPPAAPEDEDVDDETCSLVMTPAGCWPSDDDTLIDEWLSSDCAIVISLASIWREKQDTQMIGTHRNGEGCGSVMGFLGKGQRYLLGSRFFFFENFRKKLIDWNY